MPPAPPTAPARRSRCALALLLVSFALLAAITAPVASAASAPALQKGMWGPPELGPATEFPVYDALGVTLYETTLSWAGVAPTKPANPTDPADPAYRWPAALDPLIAEAAKHHMGVLLMIFGAPPWANGGHTSEYAPTNPADFAAFARAASRRYPAVRRWMIWGEPSRENNWKPFDVQPLGAKITKAQARIPKRYARMLDAAYGQLKAQSTSNLVIGGNTYTTGDIRPVDWVHNLRLPNGRPPRMDLYGHNPFSFRRPSLFKPPSGQGFVDFSDLGRFDKQIQRELGRPRHKRIRLFLSEFTIPTGPDVEFNFYVSYPLQAQWITSAFQIARKLHAYGLGWIHLRDDHTTADNPGSNGGLFTYDQKRKPGFYAFMRGGLTAAQRRK